jgi:hypothetical protein
MWISRPQTVRLAQVFVFTSAILIAACGGSGDGSGGGDTGGGDNDQVIIPNTGKPAFGLYALDGAGGTFRDAFIRDYDFLEGYAWRFSWAEIEVADGVYDFTGIDHIVTELAAVNMKLSWLLMPGTPDYLLSDATIDTWIDGAETKPLPWDADLHSKYQAFVRAVANHQIPDPTQGGEPVAFKDHSVVAILHPSFPGLPRAALRNGFDTDVSGVPGYSRENLATMMEATLTVWTEEFPELPLLISLWNINDEDQTMPLWAFAQDELARYGNVGIWQDNLQASRDFPGGSVDRTGPQPEGLGLALKHPTLWTGFQMLGSWANPPPSFQAQLANGTAADGIEFGFEEYGSLYFELYVEDLDNTVWHEDFRLWQELLRIE